MIFFLNNKIKDDLKYKKEFLEKMKIRNKINFDF